MRDMKGKKQFKYWLAFLATVTVQRNKRLKKFKKSLDKLENCYIMVASQAIKRYIISLDKLIKLLYNEYKLNKTYAHADMPSSNANDSLMRQV